MSGVHSRWRFCWSMGLNLWKCIKRVCSNCNVRLHTYTYVDLGHCTPYSRLFWITVAFNASIAEGPRMVDTPVNSHALRISISVSHLRSMTTYLASKSLKIYWFFSLAKTQIMPVFPSPISLSNYGISVFPETRLLGIWPHLHERPKHTFFFCAQLLLTSSSHVT